MGLFSKDTARISYNLPNGQSDSWSIKGSDNIAQFKEAIMTNQWNQAMAEQQNAWNLEQWNRENEYNTPAAQLQRLADAGVNPLLLDKFGGLTAANSPNAAGASATLPGYTPQEELQLQKIQSALNASQAGFNSSMEMLRYRNEQSRLQLDTAMNEAQLRAINQGTKNAGVDYQRGRQALKEDISRYGLTYGNVGYRQDFLDSFHNQAESSRNLLDRQQMENDVYRSTMSVLKRLPDAQLRNLLADLRIAGEQGKYLEFKRVIRDKYHLDPDADIWNNLLYMGLRDPDSYNDVISNLLKAFENNINKQSKSLGDKVYDVFNRIKSNFGRPRKFAPVSPGLPYYVG